MGIDVSSALLRAADHLDAASRSVRQGLDEPIPRMFGSRARRRQDAAYAHGIDQARRALAELDAAGVPDAKLGIAHLAGIVQSNRLPRQQAPGSWIPMSAVPEHLAGRAGGLRLHAELLADGAKPAAIRERLLDEVVELSQRPFASVTDAELRRIGHVAMLPDDLRPDLPGTLNRGWERWRLATDDLTHLRASVGTAPEFDHIRLHRAARDLTADPAVTREGLDDELRAIAAKQDSEVTAADMERLSLIARLPDGLRPERLDRVRTFGWLPMANMSAYGYTPATEGAVRHALDSLRRSILDQQLVADPSFTRARATSELRSLLARPFDTLSAGDALRASALAGLPEHLRPPLPAVTDDAAAWLGEPGLVLRPTGRAELAAYAAARNHLAAADPEAMARELVRLDRTGAAIDLELVAVLARQPGLLERVGIDSGMLHRQSIEALAAAGGGRTDDLAANLRVARSLVEQHPAGDSKVAAIRAEALELADRNLARMAGERTDTYARHPDYAEVGRFASIATLLHRMREAAAQAKPAAAAGSAEELLTW